MLSIAGRAERFPVHRIFCIGRNYAEHVREMGNDPAGKPIFFTKPSSSLRHNGDQIPYPLATENFHHEVELVVALDKRTIPIEQAQDHIYGYGGSRLTHVIYRKSPKPRGSPGMPAKPSMTLRLVQNYMVAQIGTCAEEQSGSVIEIRKETEPADLECPEIISTLSVSICRRAI